MKDVIGADGWLFPGDDVQACMSGGFFTRPTETAVRAADAALVDLTAQLRARNIHLLVVPVPSKASIYPDRLTKGGASANGPILNPDHAKWIAELRGGGVDVLDLTDLFWSRRYEPGGPLFHKTDSHWTAAGAELAARAIADHLRPMTVDLPRAKPFEFRTFHHAFVGDLRITIGLAKGEGEVPDIREDVRQPYRAEAGPVVPGNEAPILVIGDSFGALLAGNGCGISQQIMAELGVEVQSAAEVGGHSGSMRRALNKGGVLASKHVVIFVFAIRQIPYGGDWVPIKLMP